MKRSFKSAVNDPFIKNLIRFAVIVAAVVLAAVGIKTIRNYFKNR